jgi:molybdate transport system substrate-binding protein
MDHLWDSILEKLADEGKIRMIRKLSLLFMIICVLIAGGCSGNQTSKSNKIELTVSAAASLQEALTDIKKEFEKEHKNISISFNFGASGALQQQISQGAPVDIFFSAAEDKFQKLVDDGSIAKKDGKNLVGNDIVLIVPKDSNSYISTFEDLLDKANKISIGTPSSVPAGMYGKESLVKMNVWKSIENKIVYAKDVRQVLNYVETGNVDAGIVYKTDALLSKKVKIVAMADENTHSPIIYPAGIVKNTKHYRQAKAFFKYLQGDQAMGILKNYGFKGL